jgi:outer membrane lipoprotein-sorting protein
LLLLAQVSYTQINTRKLAEDVIARMATVKSLKYRMYKKERIKGKMRESEIEVKYQKSPFKVYIYIYKPDAGAEVLYVEGVNDKKAFVNPNKKILSLLDLDFDPYGKTLRKDEHHTLFESGFDYMRRILKNVMKVADDEGKFDEYCLYKGEVNFEGRACYKLLLTYPHFKWIDYTVKSGEDLIKIGYDKCLSDYMIMEKNGLNNYTSVKAGQKIKIPNIYAKEVILYIDKITFLPIYQEVHDDQGLYEEFHYKNLILNPDIPEVEFTKTYKDYKF